MGDTVVAGGRRGFWFPLVLLGFGLLGLLGWERVRAGRDFGWFAYAPLPPDAGYVVQVNTVVPAYVTGAMPPGLGRDPVQDMAWAVLVTVTLVVTAAWYGRRARRAGGGSVLAYVAVAVIGVVCLVVGVATMLGAWSPALFVPVMIAVSLLALARFERSRLLALVAGAVPVAMVVFPVGTLSLLIPAAIMLAAGTVALARRDEGGAPA